MKFAGDEVHIDPIGHLSDSPHVEAFDSLRESGSFTLPSIPYFDHPKFALVMTAAAILILVLFIPVGQKIKTGAVPRGRLWNFLETILLFIRDEVAKPAIGEHDYRRFLPYLWTVFLFVITLNLFGMIPFVPSVTANIMVCITLAIVSFLVIHISGMAANHGPFGYLMTFKPHVEIEGGAAMQAFGFLLVGAYSGSSFSGRWSAAPYWPSGSSPTCWPGTSCCSSS